MSKKNDKAAEATPKAAETKAKGARKAEGRSLQAMVNYSRKTTPDSDQEKNDQR
ncbi:hypothetical protein ACFYXV_29395 [Streptomyces sp. NPDC002181]|uniref:hypothetical protein n=1 Tax=Streptomyces sp. NPDC002181 TaxID=3364635 RepID=UPI00368137BF